jgi:hypothetical protein
MLTGYVVLFICVMLARADTTIRFYTIVLIVIVKFPFAIYQRQILIYVSRVLSMQLCQILGSSWVCMLRSANVGGFFILNIWTYEHIHYIVYINALLASLNARYKLREEIYNGDTIIFDTMRFGSPGISRSSR